MATPFPANQKTQILNIPSAPRSEVVASSKPEDMNPRVDTPIVDFLWGQDQPVTYGERSIIINAIVENTLKRAPPHALYLWLQDPSDPDKPPEKMDYTVQGNKSGFHNKLHQAFDRFRPSDNGGNEFIIPLRYAIETVLRPLIVANLDRFEQLGKTLDPNYIQTNKGRVVDRYAPRKW